MQKNYIFVRINKTTMATYNKRGYKQKKQVEADSTAEQKAGKEQDNSNQAVSG